MTVANPTPDKLLGVRDGLLRFFHQRLDRELPVAVVPHDGEPEPHGLSSSDRETVASVRRKARELSRELGDDYHLYVASEGGLHTVEPEGEGEILWFVRNWTAIHGMVGNAVGGSGSVQLPTRLIAELGEEQISHAVPGTRRRGGMISSLTGGLENRRRATALSTVQALSTLFYGILQGRP